MSGRLYSVWNVLSALLVATLLLSLSSCSPYSYDGRIFNRTGEDLVVVDQRGKHFSWPAGTEFETTRRRFQPAIDLPSQGETGTTLHLDVRSGEALYRYSFRDWRGTAAYMLQDDSRTRITYKYRRILDADFLIYEADAHDEDYTTRTYPQGEYYPVSPTLQ